MPDALNAQAGLIEPRLDETREIRELDFSSTKQAVQRLYDQAAAAVRESHRAPGFLESVVAFVAKIIQLMQAIIARILQAFGVDVAAPRAEADASHDAQLAAGAAQAPAPESAPEKAAPAAEGLSDALTAMPDKLTVVGRPGDIEAANDAIGGALDGVVFDAGAMIHDSLQQGDSARLNVEAFLGMRLAVIEKSLSDLREARGKLDAQATILAAQAGVDRTAVMDLVARHFAGLGADPGASHSLEIVDHDGLLSRLYAEHMTQVQGHRSLLESAKAMIDGEAGPGEKDRFTAMLAPHEEAFRSFLGGEPPQDEGNLADASLADGMPENAFAAFAGKSPFDKIFAKAMRPEAETPRERE
jgi:hypothetical protein